MTLSQKIYRAVSWFALIIFPVVTLLFARARLTNPEFYRLALRENHLVEWLTAVFLLLASIVAFSMVVRTQREYGCIHWFFAALAVLCLLTAMEEMSWGQHILGWKPPESLVRIFAKVPGESEIKLENVIPTYAGIRPRYIYGTIAFLYGVLLPILYTRHARLRSYLDSKRIAVPSMFLLPGFLFVTVISLVRIPYSNDEEIAEMFSGLAFFLMVVLKFIRLYLPKRTPAPQAGSRG